MKYELVITGNLKAVLFNQVSYYFNTKKEIRDFFKTTDITVKSFELFKLTQTKIKLSKT